MRRRIGIAVVIWGVLALGGMPPVVAAMVVGAVMLFIVLARRPVPEHEAIKRQRDQTWGQLTEAPRMTPRRRRYLSAELKLRVFNRDGRQCVACGSRRDLSVDHIIPVSLGGSDDLGNLQTLCGACNSKKSNKAAMPAYCEVSGVAAP